MLYKLAAVSSPELKSMRTSHARTGNDACNELVSSPDYPLKGDETSNEQVADIKNKDRGGIVTLSVAMEWVLPEIQTPLSSSDIRGMYQHHTYIET